MSEKTLVPIFFFWALLTIITPTLILLSENSKADLDVNGNFAGSVTVTEGMKARRMIGYAHNYMITTAPLPTKSDVAEGDLASSPAPAPAPVMDHSHHNHTSNNTNDGLTLSSNNTHIQVNTKDSI